MSGTYNIKGHKIEQRSDGYMVIDGQVTLFNSIELKRIFGDVYGDAEKALVQSIFPAAEFTTEFSGDDGGDGDTHYTVRIQS